MPDLSAQLRPAGRHPPLLHGVRAAPTWRSTGFSALPWPAAPSPSTAMVAGAGFHLCRGYRGRHLRCRRGPRRRGSEYGGGHSVTLREVLGKDVVGKPLHPVISRCNQETCPVLAPIGQGVASDRLCPRCLPGRGLAAPGGMARDLNSVEGVGCMKVLFVYPSFENIGMEIIFLRLEPTWTPGGVAARSLPVR